MWACSPSPGRISCAFKANKARNGQTHPVVGSKMKRFRFRNSVNPKDEDAFNASDLSDAKQYFLRHRGKGMQPADGGVAYISFEICRFRRSRLVIPKYTRPLIPTYCRPGFGASLAEIFVAFTKCGRQPFSAALVRVLRKLSPERLRRWALWTRRSRIASA